MRTIHYTTMLLFSLTIPGAFAQKTCTDADFKGVYGLSASGRIIVPPDTPISGPFGRAGRFNVDGAGKLVVNSTASYNGLIFTEAFDGTYKVNADCTFLMTANVKDPINFPVQFSGVLADSGKRAIFLLTNPPGTNVNATLIRQDRASCSNADMAGTFAFYSTGTLISSGGTQTPQVRVGKLTAVTDTSIFAAVRNTPSTLKLSSNVSNGGEILAEEYTGTYEVAKNCTVILKLQAGAAQIQLDGMVVGESNQVIFVQNGFGTAVIGSLTPQ